MNKVASVAKEYIKKLAEHFMSRDEAEAILNVSPGASQEEIKSAYKKKALKTHPDQGGSAEAFRYIQRAYELLTKGPNPRPDFFSSYTEDEYEDNEYEYEYDEYEPDNSDPKFDAWLDSLPQADRPWQRHLKLSNGYTISIVTGQHSYSVPTEVLPKLSDYSHYEVAVLTSYGPYPEIISFAKPENREKFKDVPGLQYFLKDIPGEAAVRMPKGVLKELIIYFMNQPNH